MAGRRSRRWCFTINNPCESTDDPENWAMQDIAYMIWQREQGLNETQHYQGAICFRVPKTLNQCKRYCERAHWEIMIADLNANIKYCTKEEGRLDGPWEKGRKPMPGKSKALIDACDMISKGKSLRAVAKAYPDTYVRHHTGLKSYRLEISPDRSGEPNIILISGPTGCGKSKVVHSTFRKAYRLPKPERGAPCYWDGYHTQEAVILDDFYSWISYDQLLRILDWYPIMVPIKHGYVRLHANTFVFTSNKDPFAWYAGGNGRPTLDRSALWRRFQDFGIWYKWTGNTFEIVPKRFWPTPERGIG